MKQNRMIEARNLGKVYDLDQRRKATLRETLENAIRRRRGAGPAGLLWALREVDFDLDRGEVVSLIGGNGSGKSTLLKILSRVTKPSTGYADIRGRLSALLEVGAGFHSELTGRENIYLSGSFLGMSRREVSQKLDRIVAFAELDRFIDLPVKHYSSGMFVRLAFAVATHLDSGILLLDEVLAVGDASFQRKCLAHIDKLARETGRTIVFVSHDLDAVRRISRRCLLLEQGRLVRDGATESVIDHYLKYAGVDVAALNQRVDRGGDGRSRIIGCRLNSLDPALTPVIVDPGAALLLEVLLGNQTLGPLPDVELDVGFNGPTGQRVTWLSTQLHRQSITLPPEGIVTFRFAIPRLTLSGGPYSLNLFCYQGNEICDWLTNAVRFRVRDQGAFFPSGLLPPVAQALFYLDHTLDYEIET